MKKIIGLLLVASLSVAAVFAIDKKAIIGNWIYTDNPKEGWHFAENNYFGGVDAAKIWENTYSGPYLSIDRDVLGNFSRYGEKPGDKYKLELKGNTLTMTLIRSFDEKDPKLNKPRTLKKTTAEITEHKIDQKNLLGNWIYTDNPTKGWHFEIEEDDDWEFVFVYEITGTQYEISDLEYYNGSLSDELNEGSDDYSMRLDGDTLTITMTTGSDNDMLNKPRTLKRSTKKFTEKKR